MDYTTLKDRTHPEYDNYSDSFELYYAAYKGGYEWLKDVATYLTSHRMEATDDFTNRQNRAFYLNYCKRIVDTYTNYIFKNGVTRTSEPQLGLFFKNADGMGGNIDDVMKRICCLSSVYGRVDCIVDAPFVEKGKEVSVRQVKDGQAPIPYVILRSPLECIDWSLNPVGQFNWVLFKYVSYTDEDPAIERDTTNIYKYKIITLKDWAEFNDEGKLLSSGTNDLNEVFVHRCYHKFDSGLVGTSLISDIAYVNKEIFNWCSLISEQIYKQTFSQLVVPDDGSYYENNIADTSITGGNSAADRATNPAMRSYSLASKIGSSYAFTFPAAAGQPPQYISPDRDQIDVIWKMISDLVIEVYRLAGLGSSEGKEDASGRSRQRQFLTVEASLKAKAEVLEKAENELLRLYCKRQGIEFKDEYCSVYAKSFDILSFTEELESEFRTITASFSPTLNKYLLNRIATKFTDEAPIQIQNDVKSEIDSGDGSILVQVSGNYVRINTDTVSTSEITNPSVPKTNPGEEPPSVQERTTNEDETPAMSVIRRKAGIDNRGNQSSKDGNSIE